MVGLTYESKVPLVLITVQNSWNISRSVMYLFVFQKIWRIESFVPGLHVLGRSGDGSGIEPLPV